MHCNDTERGHLAFVVLDLGDVTYGKSGGIMADFLEHMEAFGAAEVESFSVLPTAAREDVVRYAHAAKNVAAKNVAALQGEESS